MQVEVYLLMLQPNRYLTENYSPYLFISNDESMPLIPSVPLKPEYISMENVLESMVQYYIGVPSFNIDYVLYDLNLTNGMLNVFYYCFIPSGIDLKNGFAQNLEEIKNVTSYKKLIKKLV